MLVTVSGILMLAREEQPSNTESPMLVTLSGMLMVVSDLQYKYLLLVDYQYYTL